MYSKEAPMGAYENDNDPLIADSTQFDICLTELMRLRVAMRFTAIPRQNFNSVCERGVF